MPAHAAISPSMTATFAPVAALLLSVAILLTGHGLQGTLLPVRAELEAFTTLHIGLLGSAYYLGFALGCIFGPAVVSRVGHIRAFTAMAAIASAAALIHAVFVDPVVWWLMRAGSGFCFAVLYVVIESWLNDASTNETRGKVLSVYVVINLTVITIGQMMLTLHDPQQFPLFALASILVSLAAVPVALTVAPGPPPVATVRPRIRNLWRISPVGMAGCLAVGTANGAFWSLAPIFAIGSGMGITGVAVFMSVTVIAGAAGTWPLGWLSDRMDRRRIILVACAGGALSGLALSILPLAGGPLLLVFAAAFGAFAFPLYSLAVAHANDFAQREDLVEVSSGLLLVFAAGAMFGPVVASEAMERLGVTGLFAFTALVHVLMAGFVVSRMCLRSAPPEADRIGFLDSLQVAATVSPVFEEEMLVHPADAEEEGGAGPGAEGGPEEGGAAGGGAVDGTGKAGAPGAPAPGVTAEGPRDGPVGPGQGGRGPG